MTKYVWIPEMSAPNDATYAREFDAKVLKSRNIEYSETQKQTTKNAYEAKWFEDKEECQRWCNIFPEYRPVEHGFD